MIMMVISKAWEKLQKPVDIRPLAIFRIAFGLLMFASTLRFMLKGWVDEFYLQPNFHFHYYGFEWVEPLGKMAMYTVFVALLILSLFIALGFLYRLSIVLFFCLFTYVELIEKALYLNHYYFVSLMSFLLIFLPLHRSISVDVKLFPKLSCEQLPYWMVFVIQLQLGVVYFFAGIAKLKYDWLLEALPLKIWLNARTDFPVLGQLFGQHWFAYLMSWGGALFDLTIVFFLWNYRSRKWAYSLVVFFHLLTYFLFNIGMFPFIMMGATLIFFRPQDFNKLAQTKPKPEAKTYQTTRKKIYLIGFSCFFVIQFLMPLRHLIYSGNVLWTEEGFRYAWNVMLVEKTAYIEYRIQNTQTGQEKVIYPKDYLNAVQYKQMSFQPDMILEFAHYLGKLEQTKNGHSVAVYADCFVSMNGRPNQQFIDPRVDLLKEREHLGAKKWILRQN